MKQKRPVRLVESNKTIREKCGVRNICRFWKTRRKQWNNHLDRTQEITEIIAKQQTIQQKTTRKGTQTDGENADKQPL